MFTYAESKHLQNIYADNSEKVLSIQTVAIVIMPKDQSARIDQIRVATRQLRPLYLHGIRGFFILKEWMR